MIAITPMATIPTAKVMSAMVMTASGISPIEVAARTQHKVFVLYICILVLGGLLTAVLTVVLRQATNRYQTLVKRDADARIAEASRGAAQANERTAALEKDNLILRKDVNEAAGKVAEAQRDAADAKAAQQRVEVELAKVGIKLAGQQERAAQAERSLLELQEKLRPRTLSSEQRAKLIDALSRIPKGPVEFLHVEGDHEAFDFAEQVRDVLQKAGWDVGERTIMLGVNVVGTLIVVHDAQSAPPYAGALQKAFASASLDLVGTLDGKLPQSRVRIIVGHKP